MNTTLENGPTLHTIHITLKGFLLEWLHGRILDTVHRDP